MFSCFFFKQKTSYEMRISDWSSDVCSSDLGQLFRQRPRDLLRDGTGRWLFRRIVCHRWRTPLGQRRGPGQQPRQQLPVAADPAVPALDVKLIAARVVVVQLPVADPAGPRNAPFETPVAQDPVVWEGAQQGRAGGGGRECR